MAKVADFYFVTDPWKVIEHGFDPTYSRVSESIFALSNEYIGVRGCFDEGGSVDSLRGAYINGVFELTHLPKSYLGIVDKTHFMIPAADWIAVEIILDGEKLNLGKAKFSDFTRELDMRSGTLTRSFIWHTATGKDLRLTFTRFTDMNHGERAYRRIEFEALNFSGNVEIADSITFDVIHEGRKACFWGSPDPCFCSENSRLAENACIIQARTLTSGQEVFAAAALDAPAPCTYEQDDKSVTLRTVLALELGVPSCVDKNVVILYDRTEGDTLFKTGKALLKEAAAVSFDGALEKQKDYWEKHWQLSDVVIKPADGATADSIALEQQGIRFCSFQMAQTYRGGNLRHNIGAKGLTGEAYNGHAFWDTEACCLPFYLFTNQKAARSLLLFRYNTLPQAIERAKMLDCEGACYPIATLNGDEACDLWQHASLQYQPSTAVAYGIWHYAIVTGDQDFLWEYGAEILLQIARFLVTRAGQNPHTKQYGYYGVMGPDEFHMMVHNNAYTNYMGKRSLEYAAETLRRMKEEQPELFKALKDKTGLADEELGVWENISANMALPETKEGLIEQHDGYFDLPYLDIHSIPMSEFPLYHNWSYDRIYRTSMIKQPDVLMFLYLYNSSFSEDVKRLNYEYYEPRTIHESSLSPAVHSILAAELGKMDEAVEFFGFATRLDLDNYNRNTREGLHTTSIAMAWVNIVYGFAGLRSDDTILHFAPKLPTRWKSLRFSLTWQGRVITIEMQTDSTTFTLQQGEPMELIVYGKQHTLYSLLTLSRT
jgi:maltose phosphorylase